MESCNYVLSFANNIHTEEGYLELLHCLVLLDEGQHILGQSCGVSITPGGAAWLVVINQDHDILNIIANNLQLLLTVTLIDWSATVLSLQGCRSTSSVFRNMTQTNN